jgi:hypothetical protein
VAYHTRNTKIASLMSGTRLTDGAAAFAALAALSAFAAVATAVRSNDVAERWRSRNERGVADTDDDRVTGEAENPASEPSSTKTELPQLVQNERFGSTRRRQEPQIIGPPSYAISAAYKIFWLMTD